jgi:hypothetical protein
MLAAFAQHRRSGRYEAHVWVKATGKQLYLGGFEREEYAAEAFDIASLKGERASRLFPLVSFSAHRFPPSAFRSQRARKGTHQLRAVALSRADAISERCFA